MHFYLLRLPARRDDKIPLGTTDEHPGCVLVNCADCGARGVLPRSWYQKEPVEVIVNSVAYLDDIEQVFTTLLVSQKFRDAVSGGGLTGIEYYSPIGFKTKRDTPKYEEMVRKARDEFQFQVPFVTGWGGGVAESSSMTLRKACDKCGWKSWTLPDHGFQIDEESWDGSDFFHVPEFGPFFMSERAVHVLQSAGLSNFGAVRADEFRPLVLGCPNPS